MRAQLCDVDPLRPVPIGRKLALARELRRVPTPAERHAWSLLRNRGVCGLKFRRQHVLHGFIVDFYNEELKLVIELDGRRHDDEQQAAYDAARSHWLQNAGYTILRLRNHQVSRANLEKLLQPYVPPLPKGEGDRG